MSIAPRDVHEAARRAASATRTMTVEERYADGQVVQPYYTRLAKAEYRALSRRSALNLIGVQVDGLTQDVSPRAYVSPATRAPDPRAWEARRDLGLPEKSRQARRWAFIDGESYIAMVPTPRGWQARAFQRDGVFVEWDDPINDTEPKKFIAPMSWERGHPASMMAWDIDTGLTLWQREGDPSGRVTWGPWAQSSVAPAFFGGELPVARYVAGEWSKYSGFWRPRGEVQPLIGPQQRVIQTIFDLLLVQQFGAVVIRTMAGVELPDETGDPDVDAARAQAHIVEMAANRVLVAEDPETKFGALAATPLNPFIEAVDAAIRHFSIVASIAPMRTSGRIENVSADAITAARQAEEDARSAYRERWGDTEAKVTRMAMIAQGMGDPGRGGEIIWRETQVRSLSQIADAASKFVQAEIPVRPLVERSLGWSTYEVEQVGQQMLSLEMDRSDSMESILADRRATAERAVAALQSRRSAAETA